MTTLLNLAKKGRINALMRRVALCEGVKPSALCDGLARGTVVIPHNNRHSIKKPCAIGAGLLTKINVNIGTSTDETDVADEIEKLSVAIRYGSDTVMDLSVGGDLRAVRKAILKECSVPLGTVPIYEIAALSLKKKQGMMDFTVREILDVLEYQAQEGVDFLPYTPA